MKALINSLVEAQDDANAIQKHPTLYESNQSNMSKDVNKTLTSKKHIPCQRKYICIDICLMAIFKYYHG